MMLKYNNQPVRSEYRHSQSQDDTAQWFQPYVLQEHISTASKLNHDQSVTPHPNRPHLNINLDDNFKVKALVDSGSSICLGNSSLIHHLKYQLPIAPPINVTNVHKERKQTLGCYTAMLTVEDQLRQPVENRQINIHMQDNLSSELVLGTDFLKENGAMIDFKTNNVTFLPSELLAVSLSQKPIMEEAFASAINGDITLEDLDTYNMATFAVQPIQDAEIPFMDQKIIHVKIITNNHSMVHRPGTTIMLTSGFAPDPQIPEGLYSIDHDHRIKVAIKNSSTGTLSLRQNRPIQGIVAHDLAQGYHEPVEITRKTLRALFLKNHTLQASKLAGLKLQKPANSTHLANSHQDYKQTTPGEYISSVTTKFEEASSLLQASGLEPPGVKHKPKHAPSAVIRDNLKAQFNTSGIEGEYLEEYYQLIMQNWDIFSLNKYDVGHTPHWEHKIEPTTDEPVYVKQFKIAIGDEAALDAMSTHLTASKVLIQQPSDNNTPIFMVTRKAGPHKQHKRFVQDFRKRNAASKQDKYIIKDVRESLMTVGRLKPKIWSKLDFTGAFSCLSLEEESQKLTSFTLPFKNAQYSWARMPQGVKGASASFAKLCQIMFGHIPNIITYVDDMVGATTTHMDMIALLNIVFAECRYHGMKINLRKCQFGQNNLSWLGYNLADNGISPGLETAEAVQSMVLPTTIKEIQSHLSLFQFFADLMDNYALLADPLSAVTHSDHPWRSQKLSGDLPQEAKDAWYKLRNIIASSPVISFPDFSLPFQMFVDASVGKPHATPPIHGGVGAILTQVQKGVTRAIGYFSRQFRDSESRYNAYNAELCGLVAGLEHFMPYIRNSSITAFTDHMPLVKSASRDKSTSDALLYKLSVMDLALIHIKGIEMPADALSRQAQKEIKSKLAIVASTIIDSIPDSMSDLQWKLDQETDPYCKVMKEWLTEQKMSPAPYMQTMIKLYGSRSFIDSNNGLMYMYFRRPNTIPLKRLWVPKRLQPMIIANHHGSTLGGHWREEKTYDAIAIKYFWPSMAKNIGSHIKMCQICHTQNNRNNSKEKAPLRPWGAPTARNQRIHFDLVGPLKSSIAGCKHILSITDAFSRWVELVPIPDKQAITIAKALWDHWICRFGFYKQSVSDGGGEFANEILKELSKLMASKHHVISPYSPSINGIIERVHRSLGAYIKSFCDNQTTDWVDFLPALTFSLNTRVHKATKFSPYFITYGQHPTFPWTPHDDTTYSESEISDRIKLLQYAQQLCHKNDLDARAATKRSFDTKSKFKSFKKDDEVLLYLPSPPIGHNSKFYTPWRGLYKVVQKTSDLTYTVRKKGGRIRRAHVNRLKFYDPKNSHEDPTVQISIEDDENNDQDNIVISTPIPNHSSPKINPNQRITRSKTHNLPPTISRYSSASVIPTYRVI